MPTGPASRRNIPKKTPTSIMSRLARLLTLAAAGLLSVQPLRVEAAKPGSSTIAELVVANAQADQPQFTLLLAALQYTGLTATFTGKTPYTVFAPTDAAFIALLNDLQVNSLAAIDAKLGEGTVAKVLLFHVTRGVRLSQSVVNAKQIEMANGQKAAVNGATIEGANIIGADIRASNGVVHVIDKVILPTL